MVGYIFPGQHHHPQQIHPHAEQPPVGTAKMVHQAAISSNVTVTANVNKPQQWGTSDPSEVRQF